MKIFWYADFMIRWFIRDNEILILLKSPFDFVSMGSLMMIMTIFSYKINRGNLS